MALGTLFIKEFSPIYKNILSVAATTDLNLISILDSNGNLHIAHIKNIESFIVIKKVERFTWLEDNYTQSEYRLIVVHTQSVISYFAIEVTSLDSITLKEKQLAKWTIQNIFQSFQELAKSLNNAKAIEILKFESKEAVLVFDGQVVVSFFPSLELCPQVMSIVDLRDDSPVYKKVLLSKDILFAIDESSTKLFMHSFINNTKLSEIGLSDLLLKYEPTDFTVNPKHDTFVFRTESNQLYWMKMDCITGTVIDSCVTAFTKNFPSVKGLDERTRKYSTSSQLLCLSCDTHGMTLKDFFVMEHKLFFLYQGADQSLVGIHMLHTDKPTICHRLNELVYFIKSGSEEAPFPLLLFSETKIYLLLHDIEQNKLVNELMIYPSNGTVEALSSLNKWINIHMDIEVLKLGLSNRQLYTVEFFLKTLLEGFSQLWKAPISLQWIMKVKKECSIWEAVLNLVIKNVNKNLSENYSSQYAIQLLQVAIVMVTQILSLMETRETDALFFPEDEKKALLQEFSNFLLRMRKLVPEQEDSLDSEEIYKAPEHFCLWKKWENMLSQEVIQDSILKGQIVAAQAYFSCCNKQYVPYSAFEMAASEMVLCFLFQGRMEETLRVLTNMGIDINNKLLDIFKSTSERDIRNLMISELHKRQLLTDTVLQSVKFLSLLEKLYPCTSFQHARILQDEKGILSEDVICAVMPSNQSLDVGDFQDFNQDNSESSAYCRLVLNWIQCWSEDVEGRILAPHYLKNSLALDLYLKEENTKRIDKRSVWLYLLEHGHLPYLMSWIDIWLGLYPQNSEKFSSLDKWPLTEEMVNFIPERATTHVSETLLNELARHGVFCEKELENMSLFLSRIGTSQCDINDLSVFSDVKASLSFSDVSHRLVHYCIDHNLVDFLYSLFKTNYNKFTHWPKCSLCNVPLFNLTEVFFLWSQNHNDSSLAYSAIAGAANYLHPSTSLYDFPLNVAISLFKPQKLTESLGNQMEDPTFKERLNPYPILLEHLFKTPEERSQHDITIYELLKGNGIFDTTQLFGWQKENTLRSEDSQNELPHFFLESLSEQYGLKKELTYLYYLMEERPNYSYLKFIAQEVVLETGLSISRVRAACREVGEYAMLNYKNLGISTACICFVELLGQDSLPLRASLVAANNVHLSQNEEELNDPKSVSELGRKFNKAYLNKDTASTLVSELEQVVVNAWNPHTLDADALFKDITSWMPVMMLSHLYDVEAGNVYLIECAKRNDWLKFLVFSQIFQIPKDQVLKAASCFSNSCISYHIFHSLHRKSSLLYDVAYETKCTAPPKAQKKDMRKSLYSKIGVIQKAPDSPTKADNKKQVPSSPEDDNISISSEETSSSSEIDLRSFILKDLFSQLRLAHSSDSPWECLLHTCCEIQNPVLALLAASYPDCRIENCFFMWLYSNLYHSEVIRKQLEATFSAVRLRNCSVEDLEMLILLSIKHHKILTLWQGVHLFLSDTPLPALLGFLRSFMVYKKFDSSIESFQNELWDYSTDSDSELHSLLWIESTSILILKEAVIASSNCFERLYMLRHFSHTRIEKSFSKNVKVPEFIKVYNMVQWLKELKDPVDVSSFFLPETDAIYLSNCWQIIKKLLTDNLCDEAQKFSEAAKLPQGQMLVLQIEHETAEAQKSMHWCSLSHRIEFWTDVIAKLKPLPLHTAIELLQIQCEISDKYSEKYFLIKSIVDILKEEKESEAVNAYSLKELNKKMWIYCIKAQVNGEIIPEIFGTKSPTHDAQDLSFALNFEPNICVIDDAKDKEALSTIIGQFLQAKDVQRAFELAATFGYDFMDLKIIKACVEIARGTIENVKDLDVTFPKHTSETSPSRLITALIVWVNTGNAVISAPQKDVIKCLANLSEKCLIAVPICHQILVQYTVSVVLNTNYLTVAKEHDMLSILKKILLCKLLDDHILAKCLITVQEISDKDVARFLSEEIFRSLQILSTADLVMIPEEKSAFSDQVIYDPIRKKEGFQLIVKLCQSPSILGKALMSIFAVESCELSPKNSDQCFMLLVDLLICAHECFSISCNMDGISQILHSSQMMINLLEEAEKFTIMVHLLTGLGRYSEMMYVFDILKSKEKLKLILDKDIENVCELKLALVDYLKRCPSSEGDNYFYAVAKRFGMYRERAEILEMSVQKRLSQLCKKNMALDNTFKEELESALKMLSEAAKNYCKAECLHQAQSCTRLAQLVALQIYFVPSGVWIIGLDEASVAKFITDHDKFAQAYIVAEEYSNHHLWSQALLHNVVLRGDRDYLREFQSNFGLSTSLIVDVVKRFQKVGEKAESATRNMKFLLSLCTNVKVKYTLAQELGLPDVMSELLMGEASSYLQDLIANNTFK